jgi:hypothetical protein
MTAQTTTTMVQRLWNYFNVLRKDQMSYVDYVEKLTFRLVLKMNDENVEVLDHSSEANLKRVFEGRLR